MMNGVLIGTFILLCTAFSANIVFSACHTNKFASP